MLVTEKSSRVIFLLDPCWQLRCLGGSISLTVSTYVSPLHTIQYITGRGGAKRVVGTVAVYSGCPLKPGYKQSYSGDVTVQLEK